MKIGLLVLIVFVVALMTPFAQACFAGPLSIEKNYGGFDVGYNENAKKRVIEEYEFTPKPPYTLYDDLDININYDLNTVSGERCYRYDDPHTGEEVEWCDSYCRYSEPDIPNPYSRGEGMFPAQNRKITVSVMLPDENVDAGLVMPSWVTAVDNTDGSPGYSHAYSTINVRLAKFLDPESDQGLAKKIISQIDAAKTLKLKLEEETPCINDTDISGSDIYQCSDTKGQAHKYTKIIEIPMTNCVQIAGSGNIKILNMRGKSSGVDSRWIISRTIDIWKEGIKKIDPFAHNTDKFSVYADLKNVDDAGWKMKDADSYEGESVTKVAAESSCFFQEGGVKKTHIFNNGKTHLAYTNRAIGGIREIFINAKEINKYDPISISYASTVIHELGHNLFNIGDEYPNPDGKVKSKVSDRTCVINPNKEFNGFNNEKGGFKYKTLVYGSDEYKECNAGNNLFRSTKNNIMNEHFKCSHFSVIQCGYGMAYLYNYNKPIPDWFSDPNTCSNPRWNTVKPGHTGDSC